MMGFRTRSISLALLLSWQHSLWWSTWPCAFVSSITWGNHHACYWSSPSCFHPHSAQCLDSLLSGKQNSVLWTTTKQAEEFRFKTFFDNEKYLIRKRSNEWFICKLANIIFLLRKKRWVTPDSPPLKGHFSHGGLQDLRSLGCDLVTTLTSGLYPWYNKFCMDSPFTFFSSSAFH